LHEAFSLCIAARGFDSELIARHTPTAPHIALMQANGGQHHLPPQATAKTMTCRVSSATDPQIRLAFQLQEFEVNRCGDQNRQM
jgi:hypothetical protein